MAEHDTNLNLNIIGRDQGTAIIRAFQREIDSLNAKLAQSAGTFLRFGQGTQQSFSATARVINEMTAQMRGQIAMIEKQMTSMADVITQKNNQAIESIRRLQTEQRALASIRPAETIRTTTSTGRSFGVAPTTSELIERNIIGTMGPALERNIYYKNQDAVATARQAAADREAAAAAAAHSAALKAENANIQARIDALTGVSRVSAAESVFGQAMVMRRGRGVAGGRSSAFGDIEGEESPGFWARIGQMITRPQEMRHGVAIFDEAARGQRGAMFATIGALARDAGLNVTALATSFGVLASIMAGGALIRGVENVGKLAEETSAGAKAAGMSVEQYSTLQVMLEHVGLKGEQASAGLKQLAKATQEAINQPTGKSGQAFVDLGVSLDDLKKTGGNVYQVLELLSKALQNDTGAAGIASDAQIILGRDSEKLLRIIGEGPGKFNQLAQSARESGKVLTDQTAKSAADSAQKLDELGSALSGKVQQAMISLGPIIVGVATTLAQLAGAISEVLGLLGKIPGVSSQAGSALTQMVSGASMGALIGAKFGGPVGAGVGAAIGAAPGVMNLTDQAIKQQGEQLGYYTDPVTFQNIPVGSPTTAKPKGAGGVDEEAFSHAHAVKGVAGAVTEATRREEELTEAELKAARAGKTVAEIMMMRTKAAIQVQEAQIKSGSDAEGNKLSEEEIAQVRVRRNQLSLQLLQEEASANQKAAKQSYEDFKATEERKIAEAKAASDHTVEGDRQAAAQISAIYKEWADAAIKTFHVVKAEAEKVEKARVNAAREANSQIARDQMRDIEQHAQTSELLGRAQRNATQLGVMAQGKSALPDNTIQAYQADQQEATRSLTEQLNVYQQIMQDSSVTEQVRQEAALKTIQVYDQQTSRIIEDQRNIESTVKQANSEMRKSFEDLFNKLGDNVNKFGEDFMKAVIAPQHELIKAGLTTINVNLRGQEIKTALSGLATSFAGSIASSVQTGLSRVAASGLSKMFNLGLEPGQGLGGAFGAMIGKAFGFGTSQSSTQTLQHAGISLQQAATQLQAAASTLKMSGGSGGGAGGLGEGATDIAGAAGGAGGGGVMQLTDSLQQQTGELSGVFHSVGSVIGTTVSSGTTAVTGIIGIGNSILEVMQFLLMALNLKPSVLGTTYSMGGVVSAAGGMAVGGIPGGGGQVAVLHSKEMVLPRHLSEGVQHAINNNSFGQGGRGNVASLHYNPTINYNGKGNRSQRAEMNQLLESNAGSLAGQARRLINQGWRG